MAYNSLETRYTQWDWEFREEMLKWEQQAENLITTANPNTVSQLVQDVTIKTEILVSELLKKLQFEMRSFFKEDKQSEILVQWKGRFETKLNSLSEEMGEHAKYRIQKLGDRRAVFSKMDKEKKEFTRLMTKNVKDLIKDMKQEREELDSNLERGKLEPLQLNKLFDRNLFGSRDLERYKSQNYNFIIELQVECIKRIIRKHGLMTKECLNNILFGDILPIYQVKSMLQ